MFKKVATVVKVHKRNFKSADKALDSYNQRPFCTNGKVELHVTFKDWTM